MNERTLQNLLNECGVTLYDTEIVNENDHTIYRIYITGDKAITLEKCSEVTKIISPIIDLDPPVDREYFLEVSSPGIDRKLSTLKHFKYSIGELVKLKLQDGTKIKAKLLGVENENILVFDKTDKENKKIPFSEILKARTYFEW